MSKKIEKNNAITLIALVITIIILLILAGVSISALGGENGLINQAQKAAKENEKAKVEEEIYLILSEWPLQRVKGTQTIVEFLNSKVESEELDEIKEEGNYIEIYKDDYVVVIDFEGRVIEKIQKSTARIKISNIKVMLEDGVTEVSDNSLDLGTKVKIVFDVSLNDGILEAVTNGVLENGKVEYTTDGTEMKKEFTITGKVNGETRTRTIVVSIARKYKIQEPEIKLSTTEWTNDKITVEVDWKNVSESDKKEISVDGGAKYTEYRGKIDILKNTTIKARITTKEGVIVESELAVNKIDKLAPNTFAPTVSDLVSSTELTINANTTDQDATEEYGKSGIKGYVYYVYKGEELIDKSDFINAASWNASGLVVGESYNIYVEAYDNAGNMNKTSIDYDKKEIFKWNCYNVITTQTYGIKTTPVTWEKSWKTAKNHLWECLVVSSVKPAEMLDKETGYFIYNTGSVGSLEHELKGGVRYGYETGEKHKKLLDVATCTKTGEKDGAYDIYRITGTLYEVVTNVTYSKGDYRGEVRSTNQEEYPVNDKQGSYWYEKVN